ncbi:hypothetical protein AA313_de0204207 [Arthrobotrys entomopaga]|nr:hypothetical protein AA313_de0204207 [Arthrobotrys entomopaga]
MTKHRPTQDDVAKLSNRLRELGLKTKLKFVDNELKIDFDRETLSLSIYIQNEAFHLAEKGLSDRYVVEFAEDLLTCIRTAAEETDDNLKRAKPKRRPGSDENRAVRT